MLRRTKPLPDLQDEMFALWTTHPSVTIERTLRPARRKCDLHMCHVWCKIGLFDRALTH